MIAALLILVPIAGASAWAFFRLSPPHANRRTVAMFNWASVAVAVILSGIWCVRTYLVMSTTVDALWWPVISILGALFIFSVVLALATAIRNLVLFPRVTG